jgi:uracil-DNA glycosylase
MSLSNLVGESWAIELKDYFSSDEFIKLGEFINSLKYKIMPEKKDIFTSFKEVPFDKVKVVIIGHRPYKTSNKAIGRAFGIDMNISNGRLPESLSDIVKQIEKEEGLYLDPDYSLKGWSDQGVLLINQSMTCTEDKNHYFEWRNFMEKVMIALSKRNGIIFLFVDDSQELHTLIGNYNYRMHVEGFNNECLYKINAMLYLMEQKEIKWNITNNS